MPKRATPKDENKKPVRENLLPTIVDLSESSWGDSLEQVVAVQEAAAKFLPHRSSFDKDPKRHYTMRADAPSFYTELTLLLEDDYVTIRADMIGRKLGRRQPGETRLDLLMEALEGPLDFPPALEGVPSWGLFAGVAMLALEDAASHLSQRKWKKSDLSLDEAERAIAMARRIESGEEDSPEATEETDQRFRELPESRKKNPPNTQKYAPTWKALEEVFEEEHAAYVPTLRKIGIGDFVIEMTKKLRKKSRETVNEGFPRLAIPKEEAIRDKVIEHHAENPFQRLDPNKRRRRRAT